MTPNRTAIAALSLALLAPGAIASTLPSDDGSIGDVLADIKLPPGYRLVPNRRLSSRYAKAKCVDLLKRGLRTNVGLICITRDQGLLADMGIGDAIPATAQTAEGVKPTQLGLTLASPMARYDMTPLHVSQGRAATADVDCDVGRGPIYRATGTCRVTAIERTSTEYVYCSLLMMDHVRKKSIVSATQAESIVLQLVRP